MNNKVIVILGLSSTGLFVAQSAGKKKIPCFAFDYKKNRPGSKSRYLKFYSCSSPNYEHEKLLGELKDFAKQFNYKPILIPSNEIFLYFLNDYREELSANYVFIIPEKNTLSKILDKSKQLLLAKKSDIPVPYFFSMKNQSDLSLFIKEFKKNEKPFIIKAENQKLWKEKSGEKAYVVKNETEVLQTASSLYNKGLSFICQEMIEGPITNNYEFNALVIDNKIILSSVVRKIRQYPKNYGIASCVETYNNDRISELGEKFLLTNEINGFSNTEFKYCPIINDYYFIETNTRVWSQVRLTEKIGDDFIKEYYNKLYSINLPTKKKAVKSNFLNYKWVNPYDDFKAWKSEKNGKNRSFIRYLFSLKNVSSYGILNYRDPLPMIYKFRTL